MLDNETTKIMLPVFHFIKERNLQSLDLQSWWQRLLQLLGLGDVVDDQGVLVSGTSDLELGLLEWLTLLVKLLVDLHNARLDVGSSSQFNELLDVLDLFLQKLVTCPLVGQV